MDTLDEKIGVVQNMGFVDRTVRFTLGGLLIGGAVMHLVMGGGVVSWHAYMGLISIYPFLTGILGWDPLYSLFQVKTCSLTGRNQCGSFPYEIDAALGRNPIPDSDVVHDLEHSHHEK